jgi:hypothetical protein
MARKTKKEQFEEARAARQAELDAARMAIVNGLGWGGLCGSELVGGELQAREELRAALKLAGGVLVAKVSNAARTEIAIDLRPTNEGYTWKTPVYVEATDRAAAEVGAAVGMQVVRRGEEAMEWRVRGCVVRTLSFWNSWVDTAQASYDAAVARMAEYTGKPLNILSDDGSRYECAVREAVILLKAKTVREELEAAAATDDDLAVAAVFQRLYDHCEEYLLRGSFARQSTSALSNWHALVQGEALGRVAERCKVALSFLS